MKLTFKLTTESIVNIFGTKLYRIEAIADIPARGIKKGDKGGFISSCEVSGKPRISGNAWVAGDAQVFGNAHIDSLDAIIILVIAASYSVTITRKMIFAGCQMIKRSKVKNMTVEEFVSIGGKSEYFKAYRQMVLGAMKLVKPKRTEK